MQHVISVIEACVVCIVMSGDVKRLSTRSSGVSKGSIKAREEFKQITQELKQVLDARRNA